MGASLGTGSGKSVNVDLNIVPFIDLMSCLTAFLLVTAVWVTIAQLDIQPKGRNRNPDQMVDETEKIVLSILIQKERIWVGQSRINEFVPIDRNPGDGGESAWAQLTSTLTEIKAGTFFAERSDLELAAESLNDENKVIYQDIVRAMDIAKGIGFTDVGLTDRDSLTAKPTL
jgi:biopolymer transport protein ExbD